MNLGTIMRTGLVAAGLLASAATGALAQGAPPIKVGILHSLSGTMAISETTLKDVMLMLIEEQNKKGGVLGKKLEPSSSTRPRTGRSSPRRPAS
jgi:urea transport system substrate-binding protein